MEAPFVDTEALARDIRRGLSDVVQKIADGQRSRGYPGRSAEELRAEDEAQRAEDDARDEELNAASRKA